MALDPNEIDSGRSMGGRFFKLAPGATETVHIVDIAKAIGVKYPVKGTDYTWRFTFEDGRMWDQSARSTAGQLFRMGYPGGDKKFVDFWVTVKRKEVIRQGEPAYDLEKATPQKKGS